MSISVHVYNMRMMKFIVMLDAFDLRHKFNKPQSADMVVNNGNPLCVIQFHVVKLRSTRTTDLQAPNKPMHWDVFCILRTSASKQTTCEQIQTLHTSVITRSRTMLSHLTMMTVVDETETEAKLVETTKIPDTRKMTIVQNSKETNSIYVVFLHK